MEKGEKNKKGTTMNDSQIPIPPPRGIVAEWELRSLGVSTSEICHPNFEIVRAHKKLRRNGNKIVRSNE